jgi:hypothetical protein
MRTEIKESLKSQIQEVNKSRTSVIVGVVLVLFDAVLVLSGMSNIYSLIFILPLVIIIRRQLINYQIKKSMLSLARFIIDDEYDMEF